MARTLVVPILIFGALLGFTEQASAQDPCPSASAQDAEAGWVAYQASEMSDARARFASALARCDNDQYARTGLGYVELRDGNTSAADELFSRVVRSEPNNVDALVGLGLAAWRTADLAGVRTRFERVLALEPEHPTAVEYMALVTNAERAGSTRDDPADRAWLDGDTDAALRLYAERLRVDPEDGLAMLRVGLMRAWSGAYDDALALLDPLVAAEPTNIDARLARARVLAWNGDLTGARDEVESVLGIVPDNTDARAARALFQSWDGDVEGALESYDELLSVAPEHSAARRQYAQALSWTSDFDQSIETFSTLVRENPDDVDARIGLARALAIGERFDGALEEYEAVLELAPNDDRAVVGQVRTLMWAGRLVESERVALDAIAADDRSGSAWGALGRTLRAQGRDADALEALERAARLEPTNAEFRDQLRSLRSTFAPRVRPTVRRESDSDGNTMWTTSAEGHVHLTPAVRLTGSASWKELSQSFVDGALERRSVRGMLRGQAQLGRGWTVRGGLGAHSADAEDVSTMWAGEVSVRSPDRYPVGFTLAAVTNGLDETAILASRGIRTTAYTLAGRWFPGPRWRVDGSVTGGSYEGQESNGRRSATLAASRRMTSRVTLGAGFRGFSFERNLAEGYFDPDFYGVWEITGSWRSAPLPWTLALDLAPGVQQITSDGDPGVSLRGNARLGYRLGDGREATLGIGYSSAGLADFATGADGYRYTAVSLGVIWIV